MSARRSGPGIWTSCREPVSRASLCGVSPRMLGLALALAFLRTCTATLHILFRISSKPSVPSVRDRGRGFKSSLLARSSRWERAWPLSGGFRRPAPMNCCCFQTGAGPRDESRRKPGGLYPAGSPRRASRVAISSGQPASATVAVGERLLGCIVNLPESPRWQGTAIHRGAPAD